MKKFCTYLLISIILSFQPDIVCAQPSSNSAIPDEFKNHEFAYDGLQIPYRLFEPENIQEGEKLPLIVGLHGLENFLVGRDQFLQNAGTYALGWLAPSLQEKYPCYVLAPHLHYPIFLDRDYWDWDATKSRDFLKQLLDFVLASENIDPNRVYLTGHSMGGASTLTLPRYLNNYFAALVPMNSASGCPNICEDVGNLYNNLSIWGVHHRSDAANASIRDFFSLLESLGLEVYPTHSFGDEIIDLSPESIEELIKQHQRYFHTEYRFPCINGCHTPSKDVIIPDTLFQKWLFRQHKIAPNAITITSIEAQDNYMVNWEAENPENQVEVWFRSDGDSKWLKLGKTVASNKSFNLLSVLTLGDISLNSKVKLVVLNEGNFVYGFTESPITELVTGIAADQNHQIITYPNPAGNTVYCEIPKELETPSLSYNIVSSHGIVVKSGFLSQKEIDITTLNPGVYLLVVQSDNRYFKEKLTIAR